MEGILQNRAKAQTGKKMVCPKNYKELTMGDQREQKREEQEEKQILQ